MFCVRSENIDALKAVHHFIRMSQKEEGVLIQAAEFLDVAIIE